MEHSSADLARMQPSGLSLPPRARESANELGAGRALVTSFRFDCAYFSGEVHGEFKTTLICERVGTQQG